MSGNFCNTGWKCRVFGHSWHNSAGQSSSHPMGTAIISEAVGAPEMMRSIIKSQRKEV